MIESQKELPLRGALSSRHCEERMSAKQSRIKISGGEENVAWPGHKMPYHIPRPRREGIKVRVKRAACNEAGLKMGLLKENVSNASSLEWSTSGESENKLDIYKGGN